MQRWSGRSQNAPLERFRNSAPGSAEQHVALSSGGAEIGGHGHGWRIASDGPRRLSAKHDVGMISESRQTVADELEMRAELWREAATMVLYVSVVEIAELATLPEGHFGSGRVTGPVGTQLLAIVWGTAVGLALAHWFAFRVAAPGFRGDRPSSRDTRIGLAQLGGAALVAAASSLPVLFLSDVRAQEFTGDVPAVLIGVVGYFVARATGKSRVPSVFYGACALGVGVVVALVKSALSAH